MDKVMVNIKNENLEKVFGNSDMVSIRELLNAVKDGLCELDSQEEYYIDRIKDIKREYENREIDDDDIDPYDRWMENR